MAISDSGAGGGPRHVRCPRCRSVLQEPAGVPVYQCGGCGASLRAKLRSGDAEAGATPSSGSVLPSPRRSPARSAHLGSADVASTSGTASDAPAASHRRADATSPREARDLTPARDHHSSAQEPPVVEKKGHEHDWHRSADQVEAAGSSQPRMRRGAVSAPNASAAPSSETLRPSPRRSLTRSGHLGSSEDVASTSDTASDAPAASHRHAGATSPREARDLTPARDHHSSAQETSVLEKKGHEHDRHRSADQVEAAGSSQPRMRRGAVSAPNASATPSSETLRPSPRRSLTRSGHLGSSEDVASTGGTASDAPGASHGRAGATSPRETRDLTPARDHHSSAQEPPVVKKKGHEHDRHRSADQVEAVGSSEPRMKRGAVSAPNASAAPSSETLRPSPRRSLTRSGHLSSSEDVASTRDTASDAPAASHRRAGATSPREARDHHSSAQEPPVVEKKGHEHDRHRSADQVEAAGSFQPCMRRGAVSAPDATAPSLETLRPSPRRSLTRSGHLGSSEDVSSTSAPAPTPDVRTTSPRDAGTTGRRDTGMALETSGDLTPATKHHSSGQSPPIVEKKGRDNRSADQKEAADRSEPRRGRGTVSAPNAGADFTWGSRDAAAEPQDSEMRRGAESEPEAARKKSSGQAAAGEAAPMPDRAADSRSAPAAVSWERRDDAAAAPVPAVAEEKAASPPPRHALPPQKMSPLHEKILKTVDDLKCDLSELFGQSPEAKPRTASRQPRRPRQEGHAPGTPNSRARHAAAPHQRGNAGKHGQATLRGLPSRRYRRCRADPCGGYDARPAGHCRHSCCDHGRPECGSCREHCCRPSRAQEPARPAAAEAKRRAAPPRHHCRPVLKGAPFIVCSSCFTLVQVPAGFAVASAKVRDLRCGACSAVLSYSYRDPDRKKSIDQGSASPARHVGARPDLFSFIEDFAAEYGASSYSTTEDEQPLHVSRNSSFDTVVVGAKESHSLHRLMGYGSASELLLRRSPSLYECGSFDKRSTPPSEASRRHDDRKGKGICVEDFTGDEDSDDDVGGGALRRSYGRRAGWMPGHGVPAAGAIRIR